MAAIPYWVVQFVGQQSAQRGFSYFREGKVELQGVTNHKGSKPDESNIVVRGLIHGTVPTPYQAWASISADTISDAHCSCPVGSNGRCKHVAALILAAKAGPEQSNAKSQLVTVPAATNGASQASPSRQLWSGPFTSALSQQSSPSNQFRSQISPKKSVWSGSVSSPSSVAIPFSVQPGFSLKENSNVCAHRDPFEQASSQPSSPFKSKHSSQHENRTSLYPIPLSQGDAPTSASPLMAPQLSQGDPDQAVPMEVPDAPPNSPFVSASPASAPASVSQDAELITSLQEELSVSRQFQTNLSKQCELLREQVRFLELRLSRREAEISMLKGTKKSSARNPETHLGHSDAMEIDNKPETMQNQSVSHLSGFHPQNVHPPASKPSEEMRDSIEDALSEDGKINSEPTGSTATSNSKKRNRNYEPDDKPGLIKRLSFEMSVSSNHHHQHQQNTSINPTTVNPPHVSAPNQIIPQGSPPQLLCDLDSQTLMDAMDQFESSNIVSKNSRAHSNGNVSIHTNVLMASDCATSTSTTDQNDSTNSNNTLPGQRRSTPSPSPSNSQISTSNSETNGSKPPSPHRSHHTSLPVSLQTQQDDHSSFMVTSAQ